jgi:hypothetical protein
LAATDVSAARGANVADVGAGPGGFNLSGVGGNNGFKTCTISTTLNDAPILRNYLHDAFDAYAIFERTTQACQLDATHGAVQKRPKSEFKISSARKYLHNTSTLLGSVLGTIKIVSTPQSSSSQQ